MQLQHYQVPAWASEKGLIHGFFGRLGGKSQPPYTGLNVSYRVGDDPATVTENLRVVKEALAIRNRCIVTMNQRHGDNIIDIAEPAKRAGDGDAMVTPSPGVFLGVLTADCTPILLWSNADGRKISAVVHAGWRGTLAGLPVKAARHIAARYEVDVSSLHCALGPAIDACCYEIGEDVAEPLAARWGRAANRCIRNVNEHTYLDLKGLNAVLLAEAGIPRQQIHAIGPCTSCTPREFFSHRRETKAQAPRTGRQISVIGWA